MPRPCSVCIHEKRDEIQAAILKGDTYRLIAHDFSVSPDAVKRHKLNGHITQALVKAKDEREIQRAYTAFDELDEVQQKLQRILDRLEEEGNQVLFSKAEVAVLKELREGIKLRQQMSLAGGEERREVDPIALAVDAVECLRKPYPEAHTFLLNRWREEYERDCS